ncbi:MAG: NUDIX domain-containing protein [Alphaproteobacteria bacterium]|nr:NUDIX domain-containing protein [Alphaproteobacteria bacterium]
MSTLRARFVGSTIYAYQRVARLARVGRWPLTIGVRIIVRDGEERVLLVRHTYTPGWHFPGGAVDRRETAVDAAVRELREEALVEATSPPRLVGVFLSTVNRKSDHIVLFEAGNWRQVAGKARPLEIAETGFFPVRDLPKGTTGGTRRRLAELLGEAETGATW